MSNFPARAARRIAYQARIARDRVHASAVALGRTTSTALARAGVPVRKEFLVLRCADGKDASGLFSEVAAVVGAIEYCERWSRLVAGLRVDFSDKGLYYDPAVGSNWWRYYFEPIETGAPDCGTVTDIAPSQHDAFAYRVERELRRATAAAIVSRHVRVKPQLLERVDEYARATFTGRPVIGVHYRGTDKREEERPVPYATMMVAIRDAVSAEGDAQVFVATDDQGFLDHANAALPGRIHWRAIVRSSDGRPLHKAGGPGYSRGVDAIVDCLVLSRCRRLLRTPSNLGLFSTFFNPELPVTLLDGAAPRSSR